ncbi:MAG: metal ABC transporter solute-binding protein, Zn/Mn family [Deinococcales bacterium]
MRLILIFVVFLFSSLAHAQLQVATSFSILEDLVKNVGGTRIKVSSIVPRDSDTHSYQPSAQDIRVLAAAKVVFVNGMGFEGWFSKLAKNANSQAKIIELSKGLSALPLNGEGHDEEDHDEAGHNHGEFDPHLWWNPMNVVQYVYRIRNALVAADSKGKDTYWSNASRYARDVANLDAWAKLEVAKIPANNRKIVTNHDALGYLAKRYGFKVIGTVIPGGGTERAPSARETADLIRLIRREKVKAIFTENVVNAKLAESIAKETGAKIAPSLYTDALSVVGSSGDTYLKAFRHNISTLVAALQ